LRRQGKTEDALTHVDAAIDLYRRSKRNGLSFATALDMRAQLLKEQGHFGAALDASYEALAVWEGMLGKDHPDLVASLNGIGSGLRAAGKYQEAEQVLRRSLGITERARGADDPTLAYALDALGALYVAMEKPEQALAFYRRSLDIQERGLGPRARRVGITRINLGEVTLALGRHAEALEHFRRALDILEEVLGAKHPMTAMALSGEGESLLGLGRVRDALPPLERAAALEMPPQAAGATRFALARALWAGHGERARAIELARQALAVYAKAEDATVKEIQAVRDWLRARNVRS
jgi:serine/threonine-protein kinase